MERAVARRDALTITLATLAIIGAINWGLVGFFNFNLVDAIFGGGSRELTSTVSRVVYAIVGLAGLGLAFMPLARRSPTGARLRRRATVTP